MENGAEVSQTKGDSTRHTRNLAFVVFDPLTFNVFVPTLRIFITTVVQLDPASNETSIFTLLRGAVGVGV